ncbi:MAG: helicase-related protein [bacterium]|nr:helicase-related protein [bacterium]
MQFTKGQRIRLPSGGDYREVAGAIPSGDGSWTLFVGGAEGLAQVELSAAEAAAADVLDADGGADSATVLAGLWAEWMRWAAATARGSALATVPLQPYPHQVAAVYEAMLPQAGLRFLLADEPGTGKTIMAGLWLREAQRLGLVRRAIIVSPAHLVTKWQHDFERFLGGDLRRITAGTVREGALAAPHDTWITSLELAAVNQAVYEAVHPDRAGFDTVIFDEAHRLTPSAASYYRVGRMLAHNTKRALLMTATPHRGRERLFRSLMHLTDPQVFPEPTDSEGDASHRLRPGPLHFLRRMKEEITDLDGATKLFKPREARNVAVPLNASERAFYDEALDLVDRFFPPAALTLAKMVYGKRASSSLHALAETLRRRRAGMGGENPADAAHRADPDDEDETAGDEARVVAEASRSAQQERKAIGETLARLDRVLASPDAEASKWPRLIEECLTPNGILPDGAEQAVVFTEYADTADWLLERFARSGFSAKRYSGRDSHAERDAIRAEFAAGGFQVIVSTDAGNEGIDLQTAAVLVNWDIPWSLVRLEQRMGRIHRIGQRHKVWLYNLVATDTREGEAHARLLENLVAAANELDGKIFDSLRLVTEAALAEAGIKDLEQLLRRTFEAGGADPALAAVRQVTAERIRQIHEDQRRAETQLATAVDTDAALAALGDVRLDRINPHVVDRFLRRIDAAGLLGAEQTALADEGFWYLTARRLALPSALEADEGGRALVVTSGEARRKALEAGQGRAGAAVALGPSEPGFGALADAVSARCGPALHQGGLLRDTTSVTDYELHVYASAITTAGRATDWACLVAVDPAGARPLPWASLSCLEAADGAASGQHPAALADSGAAAERTLESYVDQLNSDLAAWGAKARHHLERLPNELTRDIADDTERRQRRKQLKQAVRVRLSELASAISAERAALRHVGWCRVVGAGVPAEPTEADSEAVSMAHVAGLLRDDSWGVTDVHTRGEGFDLLARRGHEQRCVEVKGVWESAASRGVSLTGNEIVKAGLLGDDYWLYVVDECRSGGRLFGAYRNPAALFADAAKDVPAVRIKGSALAAARAEAGDESDGLS